MKLDPNDAWEQPLRLPDALRAHIEAEQDAMLQAGETPGYILTEYRYDDSDDYMCGRSHASRVSRTWYECSVQNLEPMLVDICLTDGAELPDQWLEMHGETLFGEIVNMCTSWGDDWSVHYQSREAYDRERADAERRELEAEAAKLLKAWELPEINEEFLDRLQGNPLYFDRENYNERRMEAFGMGGMQGLNDYTDACSEYNSKYARLTRWISENLPLLYARWQEKKNIEEVQA